MQLSSTQTLPVDQATAWAALNDIAILQACIPGCESLQAIGPERYQLFVTAAVGPVKARFKGLLVLSDLQPPASYQLQFEGQGGPAGHGKGSAQVRLEAAGPAATVLHYTVQATVGGKIAQIGQRLVDMAAQRMAVDFFQRFDAHLRELHPVPATQPEPAAAADGPPANAGWLSALRAWWRRLTRRAVA
jgi:carbon monoxide dehydrogenase subunit G